MSSPAFSTRPFQALSEFQDAERVQVRAWRCPDIEVVPGHLMQALLHHGGCALGCWMDQRLIGLALGWVPSGGDHLYSHVVAVDPVHQGKGYGHKIKLAQAEWAKSRGLQRIVWTFDPLQAANARLNILKLGATASRYLHNHYGELQDELNQGVTSDRLEVDWWLDGRSRGLPLRWFEFPWPLPERSRAHWQEQAGDFFQTAFREGLSVNAFDMHDGVARYGVGRV